MHKKKNKEVLFKDIEINDFFMLKDDLSKNIFMKITALEADKWNNGEYITLNSFSIQTGTLSYIEDDDIIIPVDVELIYSY